MLEINRSHSMKSTSLLLYLSLIVSTAALVAGYGLSGLWWIVPVVLVILLILIFAGKNFAERTAAWFLYSYVALAAVGTVIELPKIWMLVACVAALISWDLLQFRQEARVSVSTSGTALFERYHLQSLWLAIAAGILLASLSGMLRIRISFISAAVLALIAVICLSYGMRFLAKKFMMGG